jgi:hypothetical protein
MKYRVTDLKYLVGVTLVRAENNGNAIDFFTTDGKWFALKHIQECCESVWVEDVIGDLSDLVGAPIVYADEITNDPAIGTPEHFWKYLGTSWSDTQSDDAGTWTFYRLGTIRGSVAIRFYGTSNGCYSETVDFVEYIK